MDFIGTLSANYRKLKSKQIVTILWKEIILEERSEEYLDQLIEYSFHYPVDSDTYLEELNRKFVEVDKEDLRTIDGHLRAYMITFLYHCTNTYSTCRAKTTILASNLYMRLISMPDVGKIFFEKNMFKLQLVVCLRVAKEIPESDMLLTMKLLKEYCLKENLDMALLKAVANTFSGVMMIASKYVVQDINDVLPLSLYCMNSMKEFVLQEGDDNRVTCMLEGLFRCLEQNITQFVDDKEAASSIIKVFIRDVLQQELDGDKFQFLLEAFCISWGKEDFTCYEDAVIIMNILEFKYYKELVNKMVQYTQSKNHQRFLINVMNLLVAMARNLPPFSLKKIEVLYACAVRNILQHLVDEDKKIVDKAVDTLTIFCLMKNNPLLSLIFTHVYGTGKFINISLEAMFLCINKVTDEKWGISPRNQNLLVIVARFLACSNSVNSELVEKTLTQICKDVTPHTLRPALPVLHELYCVLAFKEEMESARAVLKIIYKSAMHQDATSVEFRDHIFRSLLNPSVIDSITYDPKYYYNMFLTTEFEYEPFFAKCQNQIQEHHIETVIRNFDHKQPGAAVLLCCLLSYCKYAETTVLVEYFIYNFHEISISETMGPLCVAFETIVRNRTITQGDVPQLDVLHSYLLDGMFTQTYQIPSIKPAFDLLQKLRTVLRIDGEDQVLNELLSVTSERAFRRLHRREIGDHGVFMYLNELCLLMRKPPTENVVALLEAYMDDRDRIQELNTFMIDIYLQLLTLFTTLALMNKKKVPLASRYLKEVLTNENQITKILGFKLYYALCQQMTHEFEEVIKFAFKEIVVADPCLVRLCVIAIEELVHTDFIKLDAESFFKFIHVVGSDNLGIFGKELLMKRFIVSNPNDIAKFYVQSIMYLHMYSKISDCSILQRFDEDLIKMNLRLNCKKEIPVFLFRNLPIKQKFSILSDIACFFDDLLGGHCKIDENFFPMMKDFILTFRFMSNPSVESRVDKHYYDSIIDYISRNITENDAARFPSNRDQSYYREFEVNIRKCTLSLLNLLFFENPQMTDVIQVTLFDALMHWLDFVKDEIISYVLVEKERDYFSKLRKYYQRNRRRFVVPDRFSLELPDEF